MYPSMYGYVSHKVETGWVSLSLSLMVKLQVGFRAQSLHTFTQGAHLHTHNILIYVQSHTVNVQKQKASKRAQ